MRTVRNARPVTLPILKLKLPVAGWVSLLHRVSGVLLFLALPVLIYALGLSLKDPESFGVVRQQLASPVVRLALLLMIWALAHHLFAGVRHLFMDMHWGTSLVAARCSARLVLLSSLLVSGLTAWRLFS